MHDPLADQPTGDSADDFAALTTTERGWVGNGALLAVLITAAASLIGLLSLFRAEAVSGGALIPVSSGWAKSGTTPPAGGSPSAQASPARATPSATCCGSLACSAAAMPTRPWPGCCFLPCRCPRLGAWFAAGALTSAAGFRLVAALFWAGAPALQVALNQGRVGALVAHIMIPAPGPRTAARHRLRRRPRPLCRPGPGGAAVHRKAARQGPASTARRPGPRPPPPGLALAVVTAAAPSLLLPAVVLIVALRAAAGPPGPHRVVGAAAQRCAVSSVRLSPLIDRPRALLADPGVPLGFEAAPLWQQVLGQPLRFARRRRPVPAFRSSRPDVRCAVGAAACAADRPVPALLLAVAALFLPGTEPRLARALWAAALLMLAGGWLAGHVATGAIADTMVTPFTGPAVSAAGVRPPRRQRLSAPRACWMPPTVPPRDRQAHGSCFAPPQPLPWSSCWPVRWPALTVWSAQNVLPPAPAAASAQPAGRHRPDTALGTPAARGRPATPGPFPPRQSTAARDRNKPARC